MNKILHFDSIDKSIDESIIVNPTLDYVKSISLKTITNQIPDNIRTDNNSNVLKLSFPTNYTNFNISTALFVPLANRTFGMTIYYNNTSRTFSYTLSTYFYTDIHDILNEINTYMLDQINNHSSNWLNPDYNTASPPNFNMYDNGGIINIDTDINATIVPLLNGFSSLLGYNETEQCIGGFLSFYNEWNISSFDPTNIANINLTLNSSYSNIQDLLTDINNGILNYFDGNTNYVLYFDIDSNNFIRCNSNSYYVDITDCPINAILGYSYGDNTVYNTNYPNLTSLSFDNHYNLSLYSTGTIINATVSQNTYIGIYTLTTDINTALTAVLPNGITASLSEYSNTLLCLNCSVNVSIIPTTLSKILGFVGTETYSDSKIIFLNQPNILYDKCIYLNLSNLPVNISNSAFKRQQFKVPITGTQNVKMSGSLSNIDNYVMNTYHEMLGFGQTIEFTDQSFTIDKIVVDFFDRFGYKINIMDYNFSLDFEFFDK